MNKLGQLLAELKELDAVESTITQRVWDTAAEAVDLNGMILSKENIVTRVQALAASLQRDFPNANPLLVGLMDGAIPFASLLCEELKKLNYKFQYTTMSVSSYGNEMTSGSLQIGALPSKVTLFGRDVIIVDDVCDTGKTLKAVKERFLSHHAESVKSMVLVDKTQKRPEGCDADYSGFVMSKKDFIVGMGLDYRQYLRNETSIRTVNTKNLPTEKEEQLLARRDVVIKKIKALCEKQQEIRSIEPIIRDAQNETLIAPVANSIFAPGKPESLPKNGARESAQLK